MTKRNINLVMSVANDSGNGFSKTFFKFEDGSNRVTITPSLYAPITSNEGIPNLGDANVQDMEKNMDVTIKSPALKTTEEYLVGNAAIANGDSVISYNVDANLGKVTPDISIILPLTKIAYVALEHVLEKKQDIPKTINVTLAYYLTCLPISEFNNPKKRELFLKKLSKGKHTVIIKSLSQDVKVNISMDATQTFIYPEGITAQIGLIYNPEKSFAYREGDLFEKSPYSNGKAYSDSGNALLIDIGDGTTDISVMNGTHPLKGLGVNISLSQGVGTAASAASDQLAIDYTQIGHYSRSVFLEHAIRENGEGKTLREKYLEPKINSLINAIETVVEKEYRKANNDINTVVVLGGGVNALTEKNKEFLQAKIDSLNPFESHANVWWISVKYSQLLNLDGLRVFLDRKLAQK